jgi:tRNA dimethylallyltransferase
MSRVDAVTVVAVVGATAAGKSDLAVDIALAIGGEIVNVDAMQIYRGMDIGTAKLNEAGRRGVPHHLLDVLDVREPAAVADFQRWARTAIGDCRGRAVPPVLVGGSALYVRAVLDEFAFPGTDDVVRARLEAELDSLGAPALHARLEAADPEAARAILATNGRRIVRALEVVEITGDRFRAALPDYVYAYDSVRQLGVDVPRDVLDVRIEQRVRDMWRAGLVDEVRLLREEGLETGRSASRALGYRQVLRFLAGERTEAEAFTETVQRTRRFVRRQDAWFRRDPRIRWLPYDDPDLLERALDAIRCDL